MRFTRVGVVLVLLVGCASMSQPNQQDDQTKSSQTQANTTNERSIQARPESQPDAGQPSNATNAQEPPWIGRHNAPDWVMALVTIGGLLVGWRTLGLLRVQTDVAKASADAAKISAETAKTMADAELVAQRAYVVMSHNPPGLVVPEPVNNARLLRASVNVQNKGNTPARVTNAMLMVYSSSNPLPDAPPYAPGDGPPPTAYLAQSENFNVSGDFPIQEPAWLQIQNGTRTLWLLGYVDYIDAFHQHQRAGYARRFVPNGPAGNNLPFETKNGYNYDRIRNPGEGNDWNQQA